MIITYLRSSSYACHSLCSHKYLQEYVLGIRPPSGKKADKGTIVHKALEVLARAKKAQQDNQSTYEDEAFGLVDVASVTPEWATREAYDFYTKGSPHNEWFKRDLQDCIEWTNKAININKGMFDPRKRHILEPEQRFDFVIDKPWATYDYVHDGKRITGQLGLKGTIDLIVEDSPGLIEIIDWKTGARKDWAKNGNDKKTYKELRYDPQLCLYHYASCRLFPNADEIFVTIVFINDGGPYTLCFDRNDLDFTERIIRKKFEEIRDTTIPKLSVSWKCKAFCYFGRTPSEQNPKQTICQFYKDEVRKNGIEKTMLTYGKAGAFNEYGEGGGRKDHSNASAE